MERRGSNRASRIILPFALILAGLWCKPVHANYHFNSKRDKIFSVYLGPRYETHYNVARVPTTPPSTSGLEFQLNMRVLDFAYLYTFLGQALIGINHRTFGAGFKLPIVTFKTQDIFVEVGELMLISDFCRYTYAAGKNSNELWVQNGATVRYGAAFQIGFRKQMIYLELQGMAGNMSYNFFVMPMAGLGFRF